jgi:hypothetical protein
MYEQHASVAKEKETLTAQKAHLHAEVEKADGLMEAANRRIEELDALSIDLVDKNVSLQGHLDQARESIYILEIRNIEPETSSGGLIGENTALQQDLDQAREKISTLEKRVADLEPSSEDASGPKNTVIHELESVDLRLTEARIMELHANVLKRLRTAEDKLKRFKENENSANTREPDCVITSAIKRASPSSSHNSERHEADDTRSDQGRRKQPRRGRKRTLRHI